MFGIRDPEKNHLGFRILGVKKHWILDPDLQHWIMFWNVLPHPDLDPRLHLKSFVSWQEKMYSLQSRHCIFSNDDTFQVKTKKKLLIFFFRQFCNGLIAEQRQVLVFD
jgi:hypothetical protein